MYVMKTIRSLPEIIYDVSNRQTENLQQLLLATSSRFDTVQEAPFAAYVCNDDALFYKPSVLAKAIQEHPALASLFWL